MNKLIKILTKRIQIVIFLVYEKNYSLGQRDERFHHKLSSENFKVDKA